MANLKRKKPSSWVLKIFVLTLALSGSIGFISELFLENLPILPACIIVAFLILIGVIFDVIGVAFASCDQTPLISMASRKIKRAVIALRFLKNADHVSSICNDVVGDICGIVSGAAGASIVIKILQNNPGGNEILLSVAFSAIISALTIGCKALSKSFAMNNNQKIVELVGSIFSIFYKD